MGQVFHRVTVEQVEETAEALGLAAASLAKVLMKMREAKMQEAMFPWTQRQWIAQDVIATLAAECELKIQSQVNAFKQGRPSQFQLTKERSARDVAKRAKREASAAKENEPAEKRKPGRARKKASGA